MAESTLSWPVPLEKNHYVLSYVVAHTDQYVMPQKELMATLSQVNRGVRELVWTGWSMFYPFTRTEIAPKPVPENPDGSGTYVLETNLANERFLDTTLPDFWRVSPKGWATLVRAYREDRPHHESQDRDRKPGSWLSPETPVRETAELVRHAYLFSRSFAGATTVEFDCAWKGLQGRELKDFDPSIYWSPGRIAHTAVRRTSGKWTVDDLSVNWPAVVAALSCPILEVFGLDFCSADFVKGMEPRFRKLPPSVE